MYQRDFDLDHQFDPMLFICARTGKSEEAKIARHPNVAKPMGFLADLPFNQFSSNFPVYFDFLFLGWMSAHFRTSGPGVDAERDPRRGPAPEHGTSNKHIADAS